MNRAPLAPILLVLALLSSTVPIPTAGAVHLAEEARSDIGDSQLPPAPGTPTEPPVYTTPEIDRVVTDLLEQNREAIRELNHTWKEKASDAEQATDIVQSRIFEDQVGPDGRTGGFGDWTIEESQESEEIPVTSNWHASQQAPIQGNWSYAFANETSGRYEAGADAWFISPVIDLRHVAGVQSLEDLSREGVNVPCFDLCDLVNLFVAHRYNFLDGIDGGRLEVFTEPPKGENLTQGFAIPPQRGSQSVVSGFDQDGLAYTGSSGKPLVESFDLTPFVGQRIWLGFHVRTNPFVTSQLFEDPELMDPSLPAGWALDSLQLVGPSYPRNLVSTGILEPAYEHPSDGLTVVRPTEQTSVDVQVLNAGRDTTPATVILTLLELDGQGFVREAKPLGTETKSLQPGAVEIFSVSWTTPPLSETLYRLAAVVHHNDTPPPPGLYHCANLYDDYPASDNCVYRTVASEYVRAAELEVQADPRIAESDDTVQLRVNVTNEGNRPDTFRVRALLDLDAREVTDERPPDDQDVRAFVRGPAQQRISLEPGESGQLTWPISASFPGEYVATARLDEPPRLHQETNTTTTRLFVGTTPAFICFAGHEPGRFEGQCNEDDPWHQPSPPLQPFAGGSNASAWVTMSPGAADAVNGSFELGDTRAWLVGRADASSTDKLIDHAFREIRPIPTDGLPWIPRRDGLEFSDMELEITHRPIFGTTVQAGSCARIAVGYAAPPPADEAGALPPAARYADPRAPVVTLFGPMAGCANLGAPSPHVETVRTYSPPEELLWSGAMEQQGWIRERLELDHALQLLQPASSFWDVSLIDVRFTAANLDTAQLRWYIREAVVTGVPAGSSERVELFAFRPDPSQDTGNWTNGGWSLRLDDLATPSPPEELPDQEAGATPVVVASDDHWVRQVDEPVPQASGWATERVIDDRGLTVPVRTISGAGAPAALFSPSVVFDPSNSPVLAFQHRIETQVAMSSSGVTPTKLELEGAGIVFGQTQRPDGTWREPVRLLPSQPSGAQYYPVPREVTASEDASTDELCKQERYHEPGATSWPVPATSNIFPCDGFFFPKDTYDRESASGIFVTEETREPPWLESTFDLTRQEIAFAGETARFIFYYEGESGRWEVGPIQVRPEPRLGQDIELTSVGLGVAYPWEEIGVGPDTTVPLLVNVTNAGRFLLDRVTVSTEVIHKRFGSGDRTERLEAQDVLGLEPGESRIIEVDWEVPEEEAQLYELKAEAALVDAVDAFEANNNASTLVVAQTVRDVRVDTQAFPRIASPDTPRQVPVRLMNAGNVPLTDLRVDRQVTLDRGQLGKFTTERSEWLVTGQLEPTGRWVEATAPTLGIVQAESGVPVGVSDFVLRPGTTGPFVIGYDVELASGPDADTQDNTAQARIKAVETVAGDTFEAEPTGGLAKGWLERPEGLWSRDHPGHDSTASIGFGGEAGYPDNADATITSPPIDLTSASEATLNFFHNYSLETGFDGVVVEASTDGGENWTRLEPTPQPGSQDGYPAALVPGTALSPPERADEPSSAFTGTSGSPQGADGPTWIQGSIDLGQLHELKRETVFSTLGLENLQPAHADNATPRTTESSIHWTQDAWDTKDPKNPDPTWKIENRPYQNPQPHDGDKMLWSGYDGQTVTLDFRRAVGLRINLNDESGGPGSSHVGMTFWEWRSGNREESRNGSGGKFLIRVCEEDGPPASEEPCAWNEGAPGPCTDPCTRVDGQIIETDGIWTKRFIDLDPYRGRTITVAFLYASSISAYDGDPEASAVSDTARGWTLDDLNVYSYGGSRSAPLKTLCPPEAGGGGDEDLGHQASWPEDDCGWRSITGGGSTGWDPWTTLGPKGAVREIPATLAPWETGRREGPDGKDAVQWVLDRLPRDVDARLITPTLDLTGQAGSEVRFEFEHRYEFEHRKNMLESPEITGAALMVQRFNETAGAWDHWEQLYTGGPPEPLAFGILPDSVLDANHEEFPVETFGYDVAVIGHGLPFERVPAHWIRQAVEEEELHYASFVWTGDSEGWRPESFDLSPYAGDRIRLAFHAWSPTGGDPGECKGSGAIHCPKDSVWQLTGFKVLGNKLEAKPVQLRFHFASDGTGHEGSYAVDDIEVVASTYTRNVAMDLEPVDRLLPIGEPINLTASIRNHGTLSRDELELVVDVEPLNGSAPPRFASAKAIEELPTDQPRLSGVLPVPRLEGGVWTPEATRISIPLVLEGGKYAIDARLMTRDDAGSLVEPAEEILGNTIDRLTLEARGVPRLNISSLTPERAAVAQGETVTLQATASNTGSRAATFEIDWVLVHPDGGSVDLPGSQAHIEPSATRPINTTTPPLVEPGRYTVRVLADRLPGQPHTWNTSFIVDPPLVQFKETLEGAQPEQGWVRGNGSHWHVSSSDAHGGSFSWHFGPEDDEYDPTGRSTQYPMGSSAFIVTPHADFTGAPSERAFLTFWHKRGFEVGDGGVVEARPTDPRSGLARGPWEAIEPVGGYPGRTQSPGLIGTGSGGAAGGGGAAIENTNPLGVRDAFTGTSDLWERAVVNLSDVASETGGVQVRFMVGTLESEEGTDPPRRLRGQGWFIDDIVYTAGLLGLESNPTDLVIADGLEKEIFALVTNGFPEHDLVELRIDEARSQLPNGIDGFVELPERTVALTPFGETAVPIRIKTPSGPSHPPATYTIHLEATSLTEPALGDELELTIDFQPKPRADLTLDLRPEGGEREVQEGVPTTLVATISNSGLARSAPTTVRVEAVHQATGETHLIDDFQLPSLEPLSLGVDALAREATPITWTPPMDRRGPWMIEAHVDPGGRVVEFSEENNFATTQLEVTQLRRPDLVVRADQIRAFDTRGLGIRSAHEGDLVRFEARVANEGTADAAEVNVKLLLGSLVVKEQNLGILAAGDAIQIVGNQLVPRGDDALTVLASTSSVELDSTNNRATRPFPVFGTDFLVSEPTRDLQLWPGQPASMALELENDGGRDATLAISAKADAGWAAEVQPETLALADGATARMNLTIVPSASATAGSHPVRILVEDPRSNTTTVAVIHVHVQPIVDVAVVNSDPPVIPAGRSQQDLRIKNLGNARGAFTLDLDPPEGWRLALPREVTLPAGHTTQISMTVEPPSTAQPGIHEIPLAIESEGAHFNETINLQVLPQPHAKLAAPPEQEQIPGKLEHTFTLEGEASGNLPSTTRPLIANLPQGWDARVSPPAATLDPGERATFDLTITHPSDATPGIRQIALYPFVEEALTDLDTLTKNPVSIPVRVDRPDLIVERLERSPAGEVYEGATIHWSMQVANHATTDSPPALVKWFIDGSLVARTSMDPTPPGERVLVNHSMTAQEGTHAVTATVTYPGGIEDVNSEDNAGAASYTAGGLMGRLLNTIPGPSALVMFGLLAALAIARRPGREP